MVMIYIYTRMITMIAMITPFEYYCVCWILRNAEPHYPKLDTVNG